MSQEEIARRAIGKVATYSGPNHKPFSLKIKGIKEEDGLILFLFREGEHGEISIPAEHLEWDGKPQDFFLSRIKKTTTLLATWRISLMFSTFLFFLAAGTSIATFFISDPTTKETLLMISYLFIFIGMLASAVSYYYKGKFYKFSKSYL